jgi:hypothetical protein
MQICPEVIKFFLYWNLPKINRGMALVPSVPWTGLTVAAAWAWSGEVDSLGKLLWILEAADSLPDPFLIVQHPWFGLVLPLGTGLLM